MALGKIKSLEHSAKISMQSEALICAAMAPYPKAGYFLGSECVWLQ